MASSDMAKRTIESQTISLRLDKEIMTNLRKQSEYNFDSINTIVNKILRLYFTWYLPAQKAGLRFIHKDLLNSLIEYLTESEISKVAKKNGRSTFRDVIEMYGKEYSFSCILNFIDTWLRVTDLHYWHERTETAMTYTIEHGMNARWSLLLKKILQNIFEEVIPNSYLITTTDSRVGIKIDLTKIDEIDA